MFSSLEINEDTLKDLITLVFKHTGITMTERKKNLLQSRLRPRLRELGLKSYESYVDYLNQTPTEIEFFVDQVTTNETYFFRTPRVWDYLNKRFLPTWYQAHKGETLRVWSAASSSGEEIYSIAICLTEFQLLHPDFKFELFASDISKEILTSAQAGIYGERSVEGIKKYNPLWFDKYVIAKNGHWEVVERLKSIKFFSHNLLQKSQHKDLFDLVFLRNVMIYFKDSEQAQILNQVRSSMKKNAPLVLGESESIARLTSDFKFEEPLVYSYAA